MAARTLETILVEHYWPGVTAEAFRSAAERVRASAEEMSSAGAPIRFLHATFVPEDEAAFCVLAAASPDLVEEAYRRAGVGFERIVDALELEGEC
ncbi:MAG TPA: nickel-binding protein [Gaiellaceae bacterium]|jgi:hypothetical protein